MKTIGWEAHETVAFGFPNFNFGGHTYAEAHRLVREGKGRWAWCLKGVLAFVPLTYELKPFEHFLRVVGNHFEVDD